MNYRTEFPRYIPDKHLEKKKKVLIHNLDYFKKHHYVVQEGESVMVFKDEDEAFLFSEGTKINALTETLIGKAFDVGILGEDVIKIPVKKVGGLGTQEVELWALDRVLNYETDPEYFI